MAFVAAIPIITAAISAAAAISQGQQAKAAADYNAKVDEQNAQLAREQAAAKEQLHRNEVRMFMGRQRAAVAEAGVGFGGTQQDLAVQSALAAEMDALNIRYAGELEARGLFAQAQQTRLEGKQRQTNAGFQAFGSVLGGVANYAGKP